MTYPKTGDQGGSQLDIILVKKVYSDPRYHLTPDTPDTPTHNILKSIQLVFKHLTVKKKIALSA
jgi:hypothetical protein